MSSKKLKKSSRDKHNKNTEKIESGNQDVLVLPPDILQKLGINLGTIESSKENTTKKENFKDKRNELKSSTDKESTEKCNIKSSFLETANLMKESVLLSPTFHTIIPNPDLNELNMIHTNKHETSFNEQIEDTSSISKTNTLQYDVESIKEVTHNAHTGIRNKSDFIKEDLQTLDTNSKNEIKDALSKSIQTPLDNVSKKGINSKTSESKNQINIISQEVICIDSIANFKYLTSSDKRNLIPLNVDTLLTSNKILKSNSKSSSLSSSKPEMISGATQIPNVQSLDKSVKVQENKFVNTISPLPGPGEKYKMGNYYNDRETIPLNEENKESDEIADRAQNMPLKTSKVKDAEYQFGPAKNDENLSTKLDYGSSSTCAIEELGDCKDKEFNSKENLVTSKLCIQGVEKPGGEDKLFTIENIEIQCLRTYSKSKKPKFLKFNISKSDGLEKSLEYEDSENKQIDEKPYSNIEQNFCLCYDFGRFSFYEYDANYEHIHFGERQPVCSLEEFSSIYEDNKMIQISEQEIGNIENSTNELDNSEEHEYSHSSLFVCCKDQKRNVCKNTNYDSTHLHSFFDKFSITEGMSKDGQLNNEKNIVAETSKSDTPSRERDSINKSSQKRESLDTSISVGQQKEDLDNESMKSDEIETSNKNTKKRKISKTDSGNEKSKKPCLSDTVVCGVCIKEISGDEWKDHISSEHDFIAWEEGETFDLEDRKLIKKLNKRLVQTGKIICTFCDMEIFALDEFIDHIKICMHRQLNPRNWIKCGVCLSTVEGSLWIEHISKEHNYLAWEDGEPPLDLTDSDKITSFLKITSKALGGLECNNCGLKRKLVRTYIRHIKKCANIKILPSDQAADDEIIGEISDENIIERTPRKRSVRRIDSATEDDADVTIPKIEPASVVCGVCRADVDTEQWIDHICMEHNYAAWKEGETAIDVNNIQELSEHLYALSKALDGLTCAKCGLRRKYVKSFLNHIKTCDGDSDFFILPLGGLECNNCGLKRKFVRTYIRHIKKCANIKILPSDQAADDEMIGEISDENIIERTPRKRSVRRIDSATEDDADVTIPKIEPASVVCGVCRADVDTEQWIDHICMEHNYAAWKEGETAIDVNNIQELSEHLYALSKALDGLTCAKCGLQRKYVKSFLNHIKTCDGDSNDTTLNESKNESIVAPVNIDEKVECGVCHQQMQEKRWFNHIQREHSYLAWKEGEEPIDFSNDENVNDHLYAMSKKYDGLVCNKCGLTRKYVKVFLAHTQSCEATSFLDYSNTGDRLTDDGTCECGVCGEVVDKKDWQSHAMKKHYNVAWVVGDYPIDVKNPSVVEKYLKEYKNLHKKLVCSLCGLLRASILGFYAHVLQCGKTEEEIDMYKNFCDICNSKYLCIYKNQHLSMHREQELSKECKLSFEYKKLIEPKEEILGEGRRAARKALNVIEKYKSYEYNCNVCGYGAEEEAELEEHKCGKMYGDLSDSEVSVKLEDSSSSSSSPSSGEYTEEESDIDSYISEDVDVRRERRKRANETFSAAAKIKRIPFDVRNPKLYLQDAGHEYIKAFHTNNLLYPQWRECKYEAIPEEQISKYMPPIEESCKLKLGRGEWTVFKKFEAKKDIVGYAIFVGSSIQSVAWAGAGAGAEAGAGADRQYLAVSAHNATDTPRLDAGVHACPNMLQIWDFAALDRSTPEFALGIAHEYGMVWGMDWCPSGTRDILNKNQTAFTRLGLLAIACSNGLAYILSIPYPSTITDSDRKVYKLHPVAELRFCRADREMFQATSISWSSQRDHANVLVGYSDGSLALYDLQSESPLLVHKVGDVSILYPYYDERPHNMCVTGVATFPLKFSARSLLSSASPTGAECARGGGGARLRTPLACSAARHAPHWPSVLLAENDSIVNQAINELDWWGAGRRLGALHSCGGCAHCGALVAAAPPALKLMRPHPVHSDLGKETVAIIHMVPLSKKRSKQKNDDFSVKLEPFTYKEAVKTYGLEVKLAKELDRKQIQNLSNIEQCPERFPLSDIPSMAFNPSAKHHKQLALATHSGFVFVINV